MTNVPTLLYNFKEYFSLCYLFSIKLQNEFNFCFILGEPRNHKLSSEKSFG